MSYEDYMRLAIGEAEKALKNELLPVGAVLVADGVVVGKAHKGKDHSVHTDHAEIVLLRNFFKGKNIRREDGHISLYTTLEPCMMCTGTILHLPVDEVVYSLKDSYGGGCGFISPENLPVRHKDHPIHVVGSILEEEVKTMFRKFIDMSTSNFYSRKNMENPFIKYILED